MTSITDAIVKCVANSDGKSQMALGRALVAFYEEKPAQYKRLDRIPFIQKLFADLEDLEDVSDGMREEDENNRPG